MAPDPANNLLILQLQNGDTEAFQALYHQYHQAVYANIYRLVSRQEEAEDILQEVFLALWESRHKLDAQHSVAGWLFTASYYKACAYLKKTLARKVFPLSDGMHDIADEPSEVEALYAARWSLLDEAIERLPPRKKRAFQLCRLEGKSYEEAAAILNVSIDSVKDYVKTASIFLRKQLTGDNHLAPMISLYLIYLYF